MQRECRPALFEFPPVEGRRVVAAFGGGAIALEGRALLLGAAGRLLHHRLRGRSVLNNTSAAPAASSAAAPNVINAAPKPQASAH